MYNFTIRCTDTNDHKCIVSIVAESYATMLTKFGTMAGQSLTFECLINASEIRQKEDEEEEEETEPL